MVLCFFVYIKIAPLFSVFICFKLTLRLKDFIIFCTFLKQAMIIVAFKPLDWRK